jgi:aspartate-semialdehyde dehydrogenase
MTKTEKLRLALIGTDSLRGQEIRAVFNAKPFPVMSFEFFDPDVGEEYSKLTDFRGEPRIVTAPRPESMEGVDLVFLASSRDINRRFGRMAAKKGFRAIDLAETFVGDSKVPKVVAGVNDRDVLQSQPPLIANPHPASILLSHLLQAVEGKSSLRRAAAMVLQPASAFEKGGIKELADQTVAMLQNSAIEKSVFKTQAAFNLLSQISPVDESGFSASEHQIVQEVKEVLAAPRLPLSVSLIQAPVFHAYSVLVYLDLKDDLPKEDLGAVFKKSPYVRYSAPSPSCPVSSLEAAGKDKILVGQLKKDKSLPRSYWLWSVSDNLTRGSALNAYELALSMASQPMGGAK